MNEKEIKRSWRVMFSGYLPDISKYIITVLVIGLAIPVINRQGAEYDLLLLIGGGLLSVALVYASRLLMLKNK
ncbi:hypothetical protein Barb6_00905 [Bacteroidales bacterium Barb6]|nr:hypothetical protein Barb6_00905 [Bacteroidales bacterium Barb6]